jgi:competence protein ComEA
MHSFDFDELLLKYRYFILVIFLGLIFVGAGIVFFKKSLSFSSTKIEVLQSPSAVGEEIVVTAEISGAVINPGVYKLQGGSRVDDLLVAAGGFSENADRVWADKYLNRAAKLVDGQKVYIPTVGEHSDTLSAKTNGVNQTASSNFSSDSTSLVNINTASLSELDTLSGIGPVYAQKITEHRPYSKIEDLVSNGAITQTLYEKIKNEITVY